MTANQEDEKQPIETDPHRTQVLKLRQRLLSNYYKCVKEFRRWTKLVSRWGISAKQWKL